MYAPSALLSSFNHRPRLDYILSLLLHTRTRRARATASCIIVVGCRRLICQETPKRSRPFGAPEIAPEESNHVERFSVVARGPARLCAARPRSAFFFQITPHFTLHGGDVPRRARESFPKTKTAARDTTKYESRHRRGTLGVFRPRGRFFHAVVGALVDAVDQRPPAATAVIYEKTNLV